MNGWIDYSDLPKLQSIRLSRCALLGDKRDDRETISDEPYNYKNTLTMNGGTSRSVDTPRSASYPVLSQLLVSHYTTAPSIVEGSQ